MSEWKSIQFDNAGKFQYGYTESSSEAEIGPKFLRITDIDLETGNIKWPTVPYCKIDESEFSKYELHKEDILFARIGATTGKSAIIKNHPKSVFASYLIRFKPDHSILNPEFVHFFTKSNFYWNQIEANSGGKLKKGVSSGLLKKFEIPLPPLPEQKKIASVLSIIQEARETTETVIDAARELKKSMMKHLFTYGPIPVSEAEKVPLKETEIGMVPEEWEDLTLDDIAYEYKNTVDPLEIEKCRYVGLEHIISGELTLNSFGFSDEVKSAKHSFTSGDILFGKLRPYLDKVAKAEFEGICSTDILVIRNHNNCLTDYLGYFKHSKGFLDQTIATMSGVNHPRTSWNKLKGLKIGLPSIEDQKKIVEKLSVIYHKIHAETAKKEALEALFQSMLQKLMTGQLRVADLDIPINEINHG